MPPCARFPIRLLPGLAVALLAGIPAAHAGEADVVSAEIRAAGNGVYTVTATIRHDDEGWDHYADAFEIVGPDGSVLATRVLLHPHVDEQPFTRPLGGVSIPDGIDRVTIRARDTVHGHGGETVTLTVPR